MAENDTVKRALAKLMRRHFAYAQFSFVVHDELAEVLREQIKACGVKRSVFFRTLLEEVFTEQIAAKRAAKGEER